MISTPYSSNYYNIFERKTRALCSKVNSKGYLGRGMAAAAAKYMCNVEVVGVADLKCEDVQDLTVPQEHMPPNTLNFWLGKFV